MTAVNDTLLQSSVRSFNALPRGRLFRCVALYPKKQQTMTEVVPICNICTDCTACMLYKRVNWAEKYIYCVWKFLKFYKCVLKSVFQLFLNFINIESQKSYVARWAKIQENILE